MKLAILQVIPWPVVYGPFLVHRWRKACAALSSDHGNVTVLQGSPMLGMGSKWDDAAMKEVPLGAFVSAPAQMRHYVQCKGDGILQVHGVGPLVINFVGPDDAGPQSRMPPPPAVAACVTFSREGAPAAQQLELAASASPHSARTGDGAL